MKDQVYYVSKGSIEVEQYVDPVNGDSTITTSEFFKGQRFRALSSGAISSSTDLVLIETVNDGLPLYNFNTFKVAPTKDINIAVDALDDIKVVPNPYYAFSAYEGDRLEQEVKIINLPQTCTISIFTVNGNLLRTYQKDDASTTSLSWDLKNQDNINIASGLYIIHVNVPGIGEKVLKWFGVLRPVDLSTF